jgi:cytochrome c-type biogenesis protein CcmH
VCRNESIDESHAEVARDIRLLVRERLLAGATDEEVMRAVVDRYGEFILLRPNAEGANLVLWLAAPAMLVAAGGLGWAAVRRRQGAPDALSPEEEARLRAILDE